jgi:hypothetical protein
MNQGRPGPNADRLLVAQLTSTARYYARWRDLTADKETAAVTELHELAAGDRICSPRPPVMLGFHEGDLKEPRAKTAAQLCIKADANADQVPQWVAEGNAEPRSPACWHTAQGTCSGLPAAGGTFGIRY